MKINDKIVSRSCIDYAIINDCKATLEITDDYADLPDHNLLKTKIWKPNFKTVKNKKLNIKNYRPGQLN